MHSHVPYLFARWNIEGNAQVGRDEGQGMEDRVGVVCTLLVIIISTLLSSTDPEYGRGSGKVADGDGDMTL